jgi:phage-related protein
VVIRLISARKADLTRYASPPLQVAEEIWVVHAFQKKSTQGAKTPQREIDLISDRLKRLKEMLR